MIDYAVVGAYLLLMIAIGAAFRRFNSNEADYFKSGCKGTWWLVGATIFMSAFSAWTFTGAAGMAYEAGWTTSVMYLANAICLFINFLFLGAWFRQLRATTAPEIIRMRFGARTRDFYAWIGVGMSVIYSALFLYGLAIFSSTVFGFGIQQTIIALGLVVIFYCTIGGSWGVMATDFLQSLVLLPMTLLLAGLSLWKVGGFTGLFAGIDDLGLTESYSFIKADGVFPAAQFTFAWCMAMMLKNATANLSLSTAVRFFAVKDGWEARKASLLACVLMAAGAFVWIIPPMASRLLFESQVAAVALPKPAEAAYAVASMQLLPAGMSALMVVAMFASTMSSMDTGINRSAAIVIKDILPTLFAPFRQKSHAEILRWSMAASLVLGGCVILLALYFASADSKGIFEYMLNLGAMLNLPMAVPLILGLFVRNTPGWAAATSILATFAVAFGISLTGWDLNFQQKVFINLAIGTGTFLLSMPFWNRTSTEYQKSLRDFYERMLTPVDFEKEVGKANDKAQLRILGGFACIMGAFVLLLLLIPNQPSGRFMILGVAAFILACGGLMILAASGGRTADTRSAVEPELVCEQKNE